MRNVLLFWILSIGLHLSCSGQDAANAQTGPVLEDSVNGQQNGTPTGRTQFEPDNANRSAGRFPNTLSANTGIASTSARNKFSYYMTETWLNPSVFTAPAFSASVLMAAPPGKGPTRYPSEWRQGTEAFGRNYGDAFATRISIHTAQFLTGMLTREDPTYMPSTSRNIFIRSSHALAFTIIDRSDSGRPMPALSNFAGAAAGGFVGMAYRPDGFRDVTHAGQRATVQFGLLAGGNLFREFASQMPVGVRAFISLLAR